MKADPLELHDIYDFINCAEKRGYLMYAALFGYQFATLARITEAVNVTRRDIIEPDNVTIKTNVIRDVAKKRRIAKASYVINDDIRPIIAKWVNFAWKHYGLIQKDAPVFVNGFRRKVVITRTVNKIYSKIAGMCGITAHVSSHTPRKSGALITYEYYKHKLNDAFAAAKIVQQLLNHASIDTTIHYLGLQEADKREVAVVLSNPLHKAENEKTIISLK